MGDLQPGSQTKGVLHPVSETEREHNFAGQESDDPRLLQSLRARNILIDAEPALGYNEDT